MITNQEESFFYDGGATGDLHKRQTDEDSQTEDFVPIFYEDLTFTDEQRKACENIDACLFDLAVTSDMSFASNTLDQEKVSNSTTAILSKSSLYIIMMMMKTIVRYLTTRHLHCNKIMYAYFVYADNFPPNISGNATFMVTFGILSTFYLLVEDEDDNFTLSVEGGLPEDSTLNEIGDGEFAFAWNPQRVSTKPLVFVANDSSGASSIFAPRVEICACENGGICTEDNNILLTTENATNVVVKKCLCNEGIITLLLLFLTGYILY